MPRVATANPQHAFRRTPQHTVFWDRADVRTARFIGEPLKLERATLEWSQAKSGLRVDENGMVTALSQSEWLAAQKNVMTSETH